MVGADCGRRDLRWEQCGPVLDSWRCVVVVLAAVRSALQIAAIGWGDCSSLTYGSYGVERLELVPGLLFVATVDKSLFVPPSLVALLLGNNCEGCKLLTCSYGLLAP